MNSVTFRPARSTNNEAMYVPIIWMTATMIADTFGDKLEPASVNIKPV